MWIPTEDVSSVAKNIELRALAKMSELENKVGKSRAKAKVIGLGARVVAFKAIHGGSTVSLKTCINKARSPEDDIGEVRDSVGSRFMKTFF